MLNGEIRDQHAFVASELGVDAETMKNHPYNLKLVEGGYLLVCWHDQAPDGIIREGKLGSYTTHIRINNNLAAYEFFKKTIVR